MTPDEIKAIRNRLDKATPGPWKAGAGITLSYVTLASDIWTDVADGIATEADADLISHAPTDLAALLDEVERRKHAHAAAYRVWGLHRPVTTAYGDSDCGECGTGVDWPCNTIKALNGDDDE